jgi:hypothetical protein
VPGFAIVILLPEVIEIPLLKVVPLMVTTCGVLITEIG